MSTADEVDSSDCAICSSNQISVVDAITGSDLNSGVFCQEEPCTIELLFTDNTVVNRVGTDLILFEQGTAESTFVTIGGTTVLISSSVTEFEFEDNTERLINIFNIDLDDFGIVSGGLISSATPFLVACILLLYFDQRVRLEAYDLQAEADALAG